MPSRTTPPIRIPLALCLAALLVVPRPAAAQPPTAAATREAERAAEAARAGAEAAARAARAAAAEEQRLAERRVALAQEAQRAEQRVAEAEVRAGAASQAAAAARAEAETLAAALAPMLPVVRRLSLWPAESLLAVPAPPEEALRGLLVLQGVSRSIAAQAAALREAAARARRRAEEAEADRREVAAAEAKAAAAAGTLDAALQEARRHREAAADAAADAARRAAEEAARATTLRDALARLEREQARREAEEARARARRDAEEARARARREPEEPRPAARQATAATRPEHSPAERPSATGARAAPVPGQVVRGFGATGEDGQPSRGVTWRAQPGARVVSPCGGRVAYAAPFRSYGQLVILDCGDQQHFVLAGLGRLDVAAGQRILAGEPVGQLAAGGQASLYGELRRRGQPVDPGPWLAGRGG